MKILLFIRNLKGRGVSKVYLNLAKLLQENNYEVYFVIYENIIKFDNSFLKRFYIFDKETTKSLDKLILEEKIDFVISNNVKFCQNLVNISQDKIYYSVHMLWGERIFKQLRFKKLFELKKEYKNKQIIAVSNAVKKDLLEKVKIKPKSIEVIYDYHDFEEIRSKANVFEVPFSNYILNIGAFDRGKNHKLLIEVFRQLPSNYHLVLIGEGKLQEQITNLVYKYGLQKRIHFLGFIQNPYPYIKNASLVLLTSKNEALHAVAIESLILHTPVVSSNSKGIADVLTNELSFFIANSKKELIEKSLKALNNYPKIDERYYKKFGKELIQCYNKLFKGKK